MGNRVLRKALYKEFQELTEALGDLSAIMAKEEGILVKDDCSNLGQLKTLLAPYVIENLKRVNDLRNVRVHEYTGMDDTPAFESAQEVLPSFRVFGSMVREWLKNR